MQVFFPKVLRPCWIHKSSGSFLRNFWKFLRTGYVLNRVSANRQIASSVLVSVLSVPFPGALARASRARRRVVGRKEQCGQSTHTPPRSRSGKMEGSQGAGSAGSWAWPERGLHVGKERLPQ